MKYKFLPLDDFYGSSRWNADLFLLKQLEIKVSNNFKMLPIGCLATERQEALMPGHYPNTTFNYIGLENISQKSRELVNFSPKKGSEIKSRCKVYREEDLLYGRLRPNLNKCLLIGNTLTEGICSTEIFTLIPNKEIVNPEYLAEIFLSDLVLSRVCTLTSGAALPRIQIKDFLSLEVPVPSLAIQSKIVGQARAYREKASSLKKQACLINSTLSAKILDFIKGGRDIKINIEIEDVPQRYTNPLPQDASYSNSRRRKSKTSSKS